MLESGQSTRDAVRSGCMDANHFDTVTRALVPGASRRRLALMLAVLGLGTGGARLGIDEAAAKRKKKKKKKPASPPPSPSVPPPPVACVPTCAASNPCGDDGCGGSCGTCGGGSSCQAGTCVCPGEQDLCGGQCREACQLQNAIRHPDTCACCIPAGVTCGGGALCCAGELCPCFGGGGGCAATCPGRTVGQPCSFDEQCAANLFCNVNRVCA